MDMVCLKLIYYWIIFEKLIFTYILTTKFGFNLLALIEIL